MGIFATLTSWRRGEALAPLSGPVRSRLAAERGLGAEAAGDLRMLTQRGGYAGRTVTYFRVIDPTAVAGAGLQPRRFADLNEHRALHLHEGHIERDGHIVLYRAPATTGEGTS